MTTFHPVLCTSVIYSKVKCVVINVVLLVTAVLSGPPWWQRDLWCDYFSFYMTGCVCRHTQTSPHSCVVYNSWPSDEWELTKSCAAVGQSWVGVAAGRGSGRGRQGTVGGRVSLVAVARTNTKWTGLGFTGLESTETGYIYSILDLHSQLKLQCDTIHHTM